MKLLGGDPRGEFELSCCRPVLGEDEAAGESGVWLRGVELLECEERMGDEELYSWAGLEVLILICLSIDTRLSLVPEFILVK